MAFAIAGESMSKHRYLFTLAALTSILMTQPALSQDQQAASAGQYRKNGGPEISFTTTTVHCNGFSSGDSLVLVGFVIDPTANTVALVAPSIAGSPNPNGVFTATIPGGVKPRSVWLLFDRTTGGYTVAEPEGSVLRRIPDGAVTLFKGRPTVGGPPPPASATIHRAHTHMFRIALQVAETNARRVRTLSTAPFHTLPAEYRPDGVSIFDAKDGSAYDDDGTIDGAVSLTFPDSLQLGDCLFVVDDRTLEFQVLVVNSCNLLAECQS
jgi:hypothetical protein